MLGNEKSYKYRNTQTNELAMGGKSRKKAASQLKLVSPFLHADNEAGDDGYLHCLHDN